MRPPQITYEFDPDFTLATSTRTEKMSNDKKLPVSETHKSFGVGDYVWAHLKGFPSWPAIVVNGRDYRMVRDPHNKSSKPNHCMVRFYMHNAYAGDPSVAWVHFKELEQFLPKVTERQKALEGKPGKVLGELRESIDNCLEALNSEIVHHNAVAAVKVASFAPPPPAERSPLERLPSMPPNTGPAETVATTPSDSNLPEEIASPPKTVPVSREHHSAKASHVPAPPKVTVVSRQRPNTAAARKSRATTAAEPPASSSRASRLRSASQQSTGGSQSPEIELPSPKSNHSYSDQAESGLCSQSEASSSVSENQTPEHGGRRAAPAAHGWGKPTVARKSATARPSKKRKHTSPKTAPATRERLPRGVISQETPAEPTAPSSSSAYISLGDTARTFRDHTAGLRHCLEHAYRAGSKANGPIGWTVRYIYQKDLADLQGSVPVEYGAGEVEFSTFGLERLNLAPGRFKVPDFMRLGISLVATFDEQNIQPDHRRGPETLLGFSVPWTAKAHLLHGAGDSSFNLDQIASMELLFIGPLASGSAVSRSKQWPLTFSGTAYSEFCQPLGIFREAYIYVHYQMPWKQLVKHWIYHLQPAAFQDVPGDVALRADRLQEITTKPLGRGKVRLLSEEGREFWVHTGVGATALPHLFRGGPPLEPVQCPAWVLEDFLVAAYDGIWRNHATLEELAVLVQFAGEYGYQDMLTVAEWSLLYRLLENAAETDLTRVLAKWAVGDDILALALTARARGT